MVSDLYLCLLVYDQEIEKRAGLGETSFWGGGGIFFFDRGTRSRNRHTEVALWN